jgi:protein SCO1/2
MNTRRTFLATAAAAPLLYPIVRHAQKEAQAAQLAPSDGPYLPNVVLQTHDGRAVRFYDDLVKGRMVVLNMMYANCSNLCPPNTANLLQVQEALGRRVGREVFMYSLTLQPDFDRPADLRRYMAKFAIKPGWTFLTGRAKDMDLLRRRLGFVNPDPLADADLKQHTGMLRIGHDGRDRWSMMPALATPRQIVNSIANYLS